MYLTVRPGRNNEGLQARPDLDSIGSGSLVPVAGGLVMVLIFETVLPQILGLLGEPWQSAATCCP